MYRIDTGQARTDLYQNNPLEFTELQKGVAESRKRSDEVKVAKDKAAQEHMDDIMKNIGKANQIAYMPKDSQLVADKTKAISDYVEKNVEALKKGDIQATLGYQQLAGDLYSFAEQSKNFREKMESLGKDFESYRPEAQAAYLNTYSTATAGQHNFDPSILKKNVNYGDRVIGDLSEYAERAAQNTPYKKEFTLAQAETLIADDLKDEKRFEQAAYDFEKATDKLGAANPIDYYKKVYAPKLVIGDIKPGPSAGRRSGSGSDEFKPVNVVVSQLPDGAADATFSFPGKENPKLKAVDPRDRTRIIDITPMGIIQKPNGDTFLKGSVTRKNDKGQERQEGVELDYRDVADVMYTTFGIDNPVELLQGRGPKHVKIKNYDISKAKPKAAAGNKPPAKQLTKQLKTGKTVYSDDNGKTWHP